MINWDKIKETKEELEIIHKIIKRADTKDRLGLSMDLSAVHSNGCSLDFQRLLDFPDFDFYHDINGIQRHINRETGKLQNCFLPRCAKV